MPQEAVWGYTGAELAQAQSCLCPGWGAQAPWLPQGWEGAGGPYGTAWGWPDPRLSPGVRLRPAAGAAPRRTVRVLSASCKTRWGLLGGFHDGQGPRPCVSLLPVDGDPAGVPPLPATAAGRCQGASWAGPVPCPPSWLSPAGASTASRQAPGDGEAWGQPGGGGTQHEAGGCLLAGLGRVTPVAAPGPGAGTAWCVAAPPDLSPSSTGSVRTRLPS